MSAAAVSRPRVDRINGRCLRTALSAFTTGVTIITALDADGVAVGMTANSFSSVSLDPPLVLWSVARSAGSFAAFVGASHFAVHVLAAEQQPLAARFAQHGIDRFAGLTPGRGHGGVPLLDGCAARFECLTRFRHEGGDHMILVGEVLALDHAPREPLMFKNGCYAVMSVSIAAPSAVTPCPAIG